MKLKNSYSESEINLLMFFRLLWKIKKRLNREKSEQEQTNN